MNAYRGKLLVDSGTGSFKFMTDAGTFFNLLPPTVELPELGKTIEALIHEETLLDWQYDLSDLPEHEVRQLHIAVGYGVYDEEHVTEEALEAVKKWAKELENEARRIGRDRWEVHTYPAVHVGAASNFFTVNWSALGAACRLAYPDAPAFTHSCSIGMSNPFSTTGICGQADLGGRLSFSKSRCVHQKDTHIHETLGHSIMAVEHSGTGNGGPAYGETDTYMGDGGDRSSVDFNTPHLFHAKMIEENNIRYLAPGESIDTYLVQGSNDPLSMKLGENKAVLCHVADTGLTRKLMVSFYQGTVRVHEPGFQMTTNFLRTGLLETFRAANLEKTFAGVKIKVLELNKDSARVSVWNQTDRVPPVAPTPQWGKPDPSVSPEIGDWCRGQWGNKKWSVQGMHIGLNDSGKLVVHWLTWDRKTAGSHKWYWAVCSLDSNNRVASGRLITADKYGRAEEVGNIEIFWYSEESGIARGVFDYGLRFAVPFERVFAASSNELAGYYGIGNGEGLTLSLNERGHALSYWLLHESNEQVWHMISGPLNDMKIYKVDGGQMCVKSDFSIEQIGTARIDNGQFIYDLSTEGDTRTMRRLV